MASTQHATPLGDNIRAHRRALGMSQEELAPRCYVSRPSISNWECGKTQPSAEDLALLAAAFDLTADELLRDVAPASHRTSADRRELTVLFWVWLALLLVTLFAVQGWGGRRKRSPKLAVCGKHLLACALPRDYGSRSTYRAPAWAAHHGRSRCICAGFCTARQLIGPASMDSLGAAPRALPRNRQPVLPPTSYSMPFFDGTLSLACFVLLGIPIVVIDAVSILAYPPLLRQPAATLLCQGARRYRHGLLNIIGDLHKLGIDAEIMPSARTVPSSQVKQAAPIRLANQRHWNARNLVCCPSVSSSNISSMVPTPPGTTMAPLAVLHKPGFTYEEVAKRHPQVDPAINPLFVRQLDSQANRRAAMFKGASICRLHNAGAPPVITATPACASMLPALRAALYMGSCRSVRADPKMLTAGPTLGQRAKAVNQTPPGCAVRATDPYAASRWTFRGRADCHRWYRRGSCCRAE